MEEEMNLPYRTVQDAVCALKEGHFRGYHPLPFNVYDPEDTVWWLSPTSDKVAYRYGKVEFVPFSKNDNWVEPGHVFCGFCVEKGPRECRAARHPSETLQPDWFWHRFVKRAGGPLAGKIEEARDALGHDLSLAVSAEILGHRETRDTVVLGAVGPALACRFPSPGKSPSDGILADVMSCSKLSDFPTAIESLDTRDWHWVAVRIGHEFALDPSGPNDLERLAAMLEPFGSWMLERV
jgi:hypothetical protein